MNKAEFIKELKEQAGLSTLSQAETVYQTLFAILKTTLKNGKEISIYGFGNFKNVQRKARMRRNPRTGEEIKIAASKTVKFTPGKALKEIL